MKVLIQYIHLFFYFTYSASSLSFWLGSGFGNNLSQSWLLNPYLLRRDLLKHTTLLLLLLLVLFLSCCWVPRIGLEHRYVIKIMRALPYPHIILEFSYLNPRCSIAYISCYPTDIKITSYIYFQLKALNLSTLKVTKLLTHLSVEFATFIFIFALILSESCMIRPQNREICNLYIENYMN